MTFVKAEYLTCAWSIRMFRFAFLKLIRHLVTVTAEFFYWGS